MTDPHFFGYGSLVNRGTHAFADTHRATLHGWRRVWRHTALREVAYLTAVPDAAARIDGLIAAVPNGDWAELDLREHAYDRVPARDVRHPLPAETEIALYTIPEGKHAAPSARHPILLSYLDVVVQGFLTEFGEAGVERFFASTGGWDAPIADDRSDPVYPRARLLACAETSLVDAWLTHLSVPLTPTETVQAIRQERLRNAV